MSDKIRKIEGITKESTEALIAETLAVYPEKARK
jgi:nitrogenase molybdenum-iron protein alpha chain